MSVLLVQAIVFGGDLRLWSWRYVAEERGEAMSRSLVRCEHWVVCCLVVDRRS